MLLKHTEIHREVPPQPRVIQSKISIVPKLRNPQIKKPKENTNPGLGHIDKLIK